MSTVEHVQRQLLDRMLRGEFEPGQRLRQDSLAAELGVSKIPVREALHRLAATGLFNFEANRGAVVPDLNAGDATEMFTLRSSIEPQLLARSIPKLTVVDLAEAELALTSPDLTASEANWIFHRSLYRPSGWERGLAITEILHAAVAPYVHLYDHSLVGVKHSGKEHTQMLKACRGGDVDRAVRILEVHMSAAESALVGFLAADGEHDE